MKIIPTTSTTVEKIKARARSLRSGFNSLGQARDAAAVEAGYEHYHHVTECHKKSDPKQRSETDSANLVSSVLRVISAFIEVNPMYATTSSQSHAKIDTSIGVSAIEEQLIHVHHMGGQEYFRLAMHDYLKVTENHGFIVTNDAAIASNELKAITQVWDSIRAPENRKLHRTVLQHAFLTVLAGHQRFAMDAGPSDQGYPTSTNLIEAMQRLIRCEHQSQLEASIAWMATTALPESMNIDVHTGQKDVEFPSTYWSRITSEVSMEMAGFIATLPIERVRASMSALERLDLTLTVLPRDAGQRERYKLANRERASLVRT